jgi:(S)-2-hydroxy-acid oxidase/4-hydroxymandelate oxidase
VTLADYRTLARATLTPAVFDYIDCGACDEITQRANRQDIDRIALLPLCMRDVSAPTLAMTALDHVFRLPIGFSPTAFHRLVHRDGEVVVARAAKKLDIPIIVSAMSSVSLEEIANESGNDNLWLQTYLFKDRTRTRELARRAELAGFAAIVVTLGCPVPGKRDRNIRNGFRLPDDVLPANFARRDCADFNNPIHSIDVDLDPSATWRDLAWLRETTTLPIMAKGLMNPRDVEPALDLKLAAIMVSNHGGRQLDTTASTISVLPEIAKAVAGRVPIFVDGGFRRGTDALKALALGADGVFLGRPVMWALAACGEQGVVDAVTMLAEELHVALQLVGCASAIEARREAGNILRWR